MELVAEETTEEKNRPVATFDMGEFELALWQNGSGPHVRFALGMKRQFKDKDGNNKTATVYVPHAYFPAFRDLFDELWKQTKPGAERMNGVSSEE